MRKDKPLVSIIIPNYNHADYLEERMCIPADTRSPIPVIPVHSVGNLQYMWQS